jgi:hypothetical protein
VRAGVARDVAEGDMRKAVAGIEFAKKDLLHTFCDTCDRDNALRATSADVDNDESLSAKYVQAVAALRPEEDCDATRAWLHFQYMQASSTLSMRALAIIGRGEDAAVCNRCRAPLVRKPADELADRMAAAALLEK